MCSTHHGRSSARFARTQSPCADLFARGESKVRWLITNLEKTRNVSWERKEACNHRVKFSARNSPCRRCSLRRRWRIAKSPGREKCEATSTKKLGVSCRCLCIISTLGCMKHTRCCDGDKSHKSSAEENMSRFSPLRSYRGRWSYQARMDMKRTKRLCW